MPKSCAETTQQSNVDSLVTVCSVRLAPISSIDLNLACLVCPRDSIVSIDIVMLSLYDVFGLRCESSLLDSSPASNCLVTVYGQRKAKSCGVPLRRNVFITARL